MIVVKILFAAILIVGAAAAVALLTPLGARPLAAVFPVGGIAKVDFATLALSEKPNQYLVCPPNHCAAKPHAVSPIFDMPAVELRARWRDAVMAEPRVALLAESADGMQADYVQRSAHFRFPDLVTARFIPISPARSTLAIYSRSIYGRGDYGVNRERIEWWLGLLGRAE